MKKIWYNTNVERESIKYIRVEVFEWEIYIAHL